MSSSEKKAAKIVELFLADITGRRGLRQAWDEIDNDIQEEIKDGLRQIALDEIGSV